jgi:hypothetical protein
MSDDVLFGLNEAAQMAEREGEILQVRILHVAGYPWRMIRHQ